MNSREKKIFHLLVLLMMSTMAALFHKTKTHTEKQQLPKQFHKSCLFFKVSVQTFFNDAIKVK